MELGVGILGTLAGLLAALLAGPFVLLSTTRLLRFARTGLNRCAGFWLLLIVVGAASTVVFGAMGASPGQGPETNPPQAAAKRFLLMSLVEISVGVVLMKHWFKVGWVRAAAASVTFAMLLSAVVVTVGAVAAGLLMGGRTA